MSKISHLEMGAEVMALEDITVKKTFLGMGIKLIYKPTQSVVKVKENEYTQEDGRKLENILSTESDKVEKAIQQFPVSSVGMGNVKLEACLSADHQFAAVQLLSFTDFDYKPVTNMRVFTGSAAQAIAKLF